MNIFFSIIEPHELENICTLFLIKVLKLSHPQKDILSIDGKIDKASSQTEFELRQAIKPLNIYSNNYHVCIAREMIEDKTNEIASILHHYLLLKMPKIFIIPVYLQLKIISLLILKLKYYDSLILFSSNHIFHIKLAFLMFQTLSPLY